MEKQIYDFCFDYGYETIAVQDECGDVEYLDQMLLPMGDEYPDAFYDEFGENAEWNESAEYAGMEAALKDYSGKDYNVFCDGYRLVAVVVGMDAEKYAHELDMKMNWENVSLF